MSGRGRRRRHRSNHGAVYFVFFFSDLFPLRFLSSSSSSSSPPERWRNYSIVLGRTGERALIWLGDFSLDGVPFSFLPPLWVYLYFFCVCFVIICCIFGSGSGGRGAGGFQSVAATDSSLIFNGPPFFFIFFKKKRIYIKKKTTRTGREKETRNPVPTPFGRVGFAAFPRQVAPLSKLGKKKKLGKIR